MVSGIMHKNSANHEQCFWRSCAWICHCAQTTHTGLWALFLIFKNEKLAKLERGPMPNVMAALLNIGGALCSTQQSLADAHY